MKYRSSGWCRVAFERNRVSRITVCTPFLSSAAQSRPLNRFSSSSCQNIHCSALFCISNILTEVCHKRPTNRLLVLKKINTVTYGHDVGWFLHYPKQIFVHLSWPIKHRFCVNLNKVSRVDFASSFTALTICTGWGNIISCS